MDECACEVSDLSNTIEVLVSISLIDALLAFVALLEGRGKSLPRPNLSGCFEFLIRLLSSLRVGIDTSNRKGRYT